MRILVTGGAGFIGSHLVDALIKEGHRVRVFDNFESQVHLGKRPPYLNKDAEYIEGDIRDYDALKDALQGIELIFHNAAMVGVGQSMYMIHKYVDVNTLGTANLLDILVNENMRVKKLIVASSMSIYGEGLYKCKQCDNVSPFLRSDNQLKNRDWEMSCPRCPLKVQPIPTPEEKPLYSTSIYAITKKDQEEMCLAIGRNYKIPTVALRYFNVYGPRQSLSNPYTGVCAIFSSRLKNNNMPIIYEDGLQSRDFIHISDIVHANILVMNESNADYQAFNVGTGQSTTVLDIANILIRLYNNKDIKPETVYRYRSGDIRHCFADISNIEKIGFKSKVSLEDGLRELVEWGRSAESVDRFNKAAEELMMRRLIS